jgi:hypothetical protein
MDSATKPVCKKHIAHTTHGLHPFCQLHRISRTATFQVLTEMHKSHQIETSHFQKPSGSIERLLYKQNNLTQTQVSGTDFRVAPVNQNIATRMDNKV